MKKMFILDTLYKEVLGKCNGNEEKANKILDTLSKGGDDAKKLIAEYDLSCCRVCENCGKLMYDGYIMYSDYTYCSKRCRNTVYRNRYGNHLTPQMCDGMFEMDYDNGHGDCLYTTWY
jgi:hypothetical protein